MPNKLSIAFFVHAIRSDWNNGNAHFLRGLARAMGTYAPLAAEQPGIASQGHTVTLFEPETNWSTENLHTEDRGRAALDQFARVYPDLDVRTYPLDPVALRACLADHDIVIVHEWNEPELIDLVLKLRDELGFRALFHDTHHRASSSPAQLARLQVTRFDGVIAFGEALRTIYLHHFKVERAWTLHEAADTTVFFPRAAVPQHDVLWIGNWGDDERSREIREYLTEPACQLPTRSFCIYGVRYPAHALQTLDAAGVAYGGYLPNLDAPAAYASAHATVHIPRQQYTKAMAGIPTIRVFEALASAIPLVSAPWQDVECLFAPGDFLSAHSRQEMIEALEFLLGNPQAAAEQAAQGLTTLLGRHTCAHRAQELTNICEEVLA